MKNVLLSTAALVMTAGGALAGGMEVGRFSPSFLFQDGNYAEFGMRSTDPKVTDDLYAPNSSMLGKMSNKSASVKMGLSDRLSIGLTHFDAARIDLSYVGAGGPFAMVPDPTTAAAQGPAILGGAAASSDPATQLAIAAYAPTAMAAGASTPQEIAGMALTMDPATQQAAGAYVAGLSDAQKSQILLASGVPAADEPYVDLVFKSTALVMNYAVTDQIDVYGGIKRSTGSATGNVLTNPNGDLVAESGSANSPILGVSYSKPEIALRVSATYQGKAETSHTTTRTFGGVTNTLEPTKAALPEMLTLDFQTGIAANTLLFGSVHHAKWDAAQIYFDGSTEAKSTWSDSTTLSLGVGRKLSEAWSVSASVNYEKATESTGESLLSTTDGTKGITLGARYAQDNMTVSVGVNHSKFGDKVVTTALGPGDFSDNSATTVGVVVGFSF